MKKTIALLAMVLGATSAFASGSRSGGTQYVQPHPGLDSVFISVAGDELNALTVRRSSTATSISVEAKVWWNDDLAKVGGYGHANSMSVIETKDLERFHHSNHTFDFQNAFEVRSERKNAGTGCQLFSPSSGKVQGVCTEIIVTIPSYASFEQEYNTTQTMDTLGNEVGLYVYNLRQPLPPPPSSGLIRVSGQELYSVTNMLNDFMSSDLTKAQNLERFIQRKCDGF
jgi:hypothetical protein